MIYKMHNKEKES